MIAYKVIKAHTGTEGLGVSAITEAFAVVYSREKIAVPSIKGSFCFVFFTREQAGQFLCQEIFRSHRVIMDTVELQTWECEVEDVTFHLPPTSSCSGYFDFYENWERFHERFHRLSKDWPPGTFGARKVKLLRRVG